MGCAVGAAYGTSQYGGPRRAISIISSYEFHVCTRHTTFIPLLGPSRMKQVERRHWDCTFNHDVTWGKTQQGEQTINEFVLLGELGRGSYGRVQLCERRRGNPPWRRFAMKIMSKPRLRRISEYVNVPTGGMRKVTAEDKVLLWCETMPGRNRRGHTAQTVLLFAIDDRSTRVNAAMVWLSVTVLLLQLVL